MVTYFRATGGAWHARTIRTHTTHVARGVQNVKNYFLVTGSSGSDFRIFYHACLSLCFALFVCPCVL